MLVKEDPRKKGGFKPVNTLYTSQLPTFATSSIIPQHLERGEQPHSQVAASAMVNEREAPHYGGARKPDSSQTHPPAQPPSEQPPFSDRSSQPQFGKTSPLRNSLQTSSVFNVPNPNRPRPEHHRSIFRPPPSHSQTTHATGDSQAPAQHQNPDLNQIRPHSTFNGSNAITEDFFEQARIPTHSGLPTHGRKPGKTGFIHPDSVLHSQPPVMSQQLSSQPGNIGAHGPSIQPRPLFSSRHGFEPVNAFKAPKQNIVDLSGEQDEDAFNPDAALGETKFGDYDPYTYIDPEKTSENIKALLEGAFEDEDDKPKLRLRKKQKKEPQTSAEQLSEKLKAVKVDEDKENKEEPTEEEDDGSVDGLNVRLLPHQIDGVAWMLDKEIGTRKKNGVLPNGGILADDMGLGKTIQALSLIISNPRPKGDIISEKPKRKLPKECSKSTLVVAPLALIKQWESEVKTKISRSHDFKVLVHHGSSRTKRSEDLKKYDLVVTTYQTLTSEADGSSDLDDGVKIGCMGVCWYRVILDEAHSIRNRNAKMTKAAYKLNGMYRWCLTGTPMQNNLDELQSLIRFLRIKPYNELSAWKDQISGPMKNGRGGLAMKRLQYFLRAFMKRRTKDVLKQDGALNFGRTKEGESSANKTGFKIVGRDVQTIVAEFDETERGFYDRLQARTEISLQNMMGGSSNDYIGALVLLLRLRQVCNHPDLIRKNLKSEKDVISQSSKTSELKSSPRSKSSTGSGDVDDIAEMFGSLTVETKKCDVCQIKLEKEDVAAGAIRCKECEADLNDQEQKAIKGSGKSKKNAKRSKKERQRAARRVIESDDENEESSHHDDNDEDDEDIVDGEWVVPRSQQTYPSLGKAGGSDDEDAEGGGQWLESEDSDTEDESVVKIGRFHERGKFIKDKSKSKHGDDSSDDSESGVIDLTAGRIPSTKIRRLIRLLEDESKDHKFIVFSEFTSMLDIIEPFLAAKHFNFVRYDGSMRNDDREASLNLLRNNPSTRILLCSLRCGSLGLNLTAASRVVILEPFWNPFVEEQAIDRVHRLNQTQDVKVYRLTIANSVEERILALQEKKRELVKTAIEGGKGVAKLSMQDILHLFGRDADKDSRYETAAPKLGFAAGDGSDRSKTKQRVPSAASGNDSVYGRRW